MRLTSTILFVLIQPGPHSNEASAQENRRPVPSPEAQKEAEKLVREVFKDDYARKTPLDKTALARKLLQQGMETKDDPAAQFILLREARELASQGGDITIALNAIDETCARFEVDGTPLRTAVLSTAVQSVKTPEEAKALAEAYVGIAEDAVKEDQFDAAEKAMGAAAGLARKTKEIALVTRTEARLREISDLRSKHEKLKKAREILQTSPDDPAANLSMGQHLCWFKGDWAKGLLHLTKGSDGGLKALAARDLKDPAESAEQLVVADGWWDLAEKASGIAKGNLQARAGFWYAKAYPKVAGLNKAKVEKRLAEAGAGGIAQLEVDLLALIDPKQDLVEGTWERAGKVLVSPVVRWSRIQVPYVPPDDYDLKIVTERKSGIASFEIGLASRGTQFHVGFDGWARGDITGLNLVNGKDGSSNETTYRGKLLPKDKPTTILCSVRGTGVTVKVEDKVVFDWKGDPSQLSASSWWKTPRSDTLFLGAWEACFHVHKVSLIPQSGDGKKLR